MNTSSTAIGSAFAKPLVWFKQLTFVGAALVCQACPNNPQCGDSYVDIAEECDDGNVHAGDGCNTSCELEPGYSCETAGVACEGAIIPVCGDGILTAGEECDDGNPYAGDGCSASCQLEPGYQCQTAGSACEGAPIPVCGDGILTAAEECDDGIYNAVGYNLCAPDCTLGPNCGDGVLDVPYEECDDGVNAGDSECTPWCGRR